MAKAKTARATKSGGRTKAYTSLTVEVRNGVGLLALARPDVHNAFDETLIAEMTRALTELERDDAVRVVVLLGAGASFCAGADLNWMKRMAGYGHAENLADAMALAHMLRTLYRLPKPTIARVHGAAFGGGVGLVACCDIAIAAQEATFALSEAKLGLIPGDDRPVRRRGDRRADGAALFPHRRALHRRRGLPDRPRARPRAGERARQPDQRAPRRAVPRRPARAGGVEGADPRDRRTGRSTTR